VNEVWINGNSASAVDLDAIAATRYGHFTTLQVRSGAARGLDLHLQRLRDATAELFAMPLDAERIRDAMRHALQASGARDCTLRFAVHARDFDPETDAVPASLDLVVRVAPPAEPDGHGLRLKSFAYARPLPHLKHVATLPQFQRRRLAVRDGFDDALFAGPDGRVSEGSFWNIGFLAGDTIVWPQAPALRGTCECLLQAGLAQIGVTQATRPVALEDLGGLQGAFVANSRGVQAVAAIDDVAWTPHPGLLALLARALASQPWQPL
jgi:branched-subunit amino acid aminotransferase/4-amino-4-deoxychorismate lyase